jgi:hypothetical protein
MDRPAHQTGNLSPVPGHGPSDPWPQTVHACVESTVASSQRSDWPRIDANTLFGDSTGESERELGLHLVPK